MNEIITKNGRRWKIIKTYTADQLIAEGREAFGSVLKKKKESLVYLLPKNGGAVWCARQWIDGKLHKWEKMPD